ncbi:MAG: cytochrome P450 [Thermodesulfobacteriota bacterium]
MSTVTTTARPAELREFDPYDWSFHEDPYPTYRWLRDEAPAYHNPKIGFWAVSRYDDVLAAFKDTEHLSSAKGVSLEQSSHADPSETASFIAMDPPRHDVMRGLVARGFTPRRVSELEPRIREIATEHIDRFVEQGRCDFIRDFAGKLPMDVISEMLGVPVADRDVLRHWADTLLHREDGVREIPQAGIEAAFQIVGYFQELVKDRHARPTSDLPSALLAAELDGRRLTDKEVISFLFLMVIAGNETTTKLLGNALYSLWKNPEQRALVRADERLVPAWVEETLRYDPSTQLLARTVRGEYELHGRRMRDGERVLILIGAANRDERVFRDPDVYDLRRDASAHLAFGKGTHFCMGASLARLEGRIALEEVRRRLPDFEIDASGLVRVHSTNVRGFAAMPIAFTPGRSEG